MSDHLRSAISDAILYNLGLIQEGDTITLGNGTVYTFKKSLLDITDEPKDPENFVELPACNVIYGPERCHNQSDGILQVSGTNKQILENGFSLFLHIFGMSENRRKWAEDMLADVQAILGTKYQLNDSNGIATVFTSVYAGSEPFLLKTIKPNCALEVEYEVRYRQRREDPTEKI